MKIYELLNHPDKWTKQVFARTSSGESVLPGDTRAVAWCLLGALRKCYPEYWTRFAAHWKIRNEILGEIAAWNDSSERKYKEVIKLARKLNV